MRIQKVLVIGSGLMGSGIAQVCAQAGIQVYLHDVSKQALTKAIKTVDWSVGKFIEKGKLSEDRDSIMARIRLITDLNDGKEVDLAIEAVYEKLELKQDVFQKLDKKFAIKLYASLKETAIHIAEASGGVFGYMSVGYEESRLIDLKMIKDPSK